MGFLPCLLFIVVLLTLNSCRKDDVTSSPTVQILSPAVNEIFNLPGELKIHLKIKSEKAIKFVQVSFINYDDASIFKPQQYYTDSTFVEIEDTIKLGVLPQGLFSPYYLYITVVDGAGTNTYFRQVDFINPDLKYKGLYVSTRPSMGTTQVYYYDPDFQESLFTTVEGEFLGSTSSDYQDFYYLTTSTPAHFYAYTHQDSELIWKASAELPIPEYTAIHYNDNIVFTATANGRIRSFNAVTGTPDIVTAAMVDSIPLHIQASSDYIVGEFLSKNSNNNLLALFYRSTGTLVHKKPLNFAVADIFVGKNEINFLVFGNEVETSLLTTYHPLGNFLSDDKTIKEGIIKQVVRYNPDRFFLNISNRIYLYNYSTGVNKLIIEFVDEVAQFKYDYINNRLLVAFENHVEIYSYPGNELVHLQTIPHPVNSMDLRYTY